ncbi:hypothetical protein NXW96_22155 [Bacteroides fragilis]|nr:hypothetical protein [Bacteroides fragilis]
MYLLERFGGASAQIVKGY